MVKVCRCGDPTPHVHLGAHGVVDANIPSDVSSDAPTRRVDVPLHMQETQPLPGEGLDEGEDADLLAMLAAWAADCEVDLSGIFPRDLLRLRDRMQGLREGTVTPESGADLAALAAWRARCRTGDSKED